jgi:DNA-binding XRE family transcriptional regulator
MNTLKMKSARELLADKLKDASFKKEYDECEKEFALAKEVIRLRIKNKMTQTQLAKLAGTSQPAIARLESGTYQNLSLSFLRKVGKVLGVFPEVHFRKAAV